MDHESACGLISRAPGGSSVLDKSLRKDILLSFTRYVHMMLCRYITEIMDFFKCKMMTKPQTYKPQVRIPSDAHRNRVSMLSVPQTLPGLNYLPSNLHIAKPSALSICSSVEFPGFVFLIDDVRALADDTQIDPHAQLAFSALNRVSKVRADHARCS